MISEIEVEQNLAGHIPPPAPISLVLGYKTKQLMTRTIVTDSVSDTHSRAVLHIL